MEESLYINGSKVDPYVRPTGGGPVEPHVIENWTFGDPDLQVPETSKDPQWVRPGLQSLYDDSEELLRLLQKRVNENKNADWRDFKDEARIRRIAESVGTVADHLQFRLVGEINKAFSEVEAVDKLMLSASEPKPPATVPEAVNQGFRGMELRQHLRGLTPQERMSIVEQALESGDFWIFNEAMNGYPPLLDKETVADLRKKYALKRWPWLAEQRKDTELKANFVLARARKIAGIAGYSMIHHQLGLDYTPPPETMETWNRFGRHNPEDFIAAQYDHGEELKELVSRRR